MANPLNRQIGPAPRGDPQPFDEGDAEAGGGPKAPNPLPGDGSDTPEQEEGPPPDEPQDDQPEPAADDDGPMSDEEFRETVSRNTAQRIRGLGEGVVAFATGTRGKFTEYFVQAPGSKGVNIAGADPLGTAKAYLESRLDSGADTTTDQQTTESGPSEPAPARDTQPKLSRTLTPATTRTGPAAGTGFASGGTPEAAAIETQITQEPQREERFGGTSGFEEFLRDSSETFQGVAKAGGEITALALSPSPSELSAAARGDFDPITSIDDSNERFTSEFVRGGISSVDPFATGVAVIEAGEAGKYVLDESAAGRGGEAVDEVASAAEEEAKLIASESYESFKDRPVETTARLAGSLVGSALVFKGASAVGSKTRLATGAAVQPGEEILERIGGRLVGRPGQPFGNEELAIAGAKRVVKRLDPESDTGRVGAGLVPRGESRKTTITKDDIAPGSVGRDVDPRQVGDPELTRSSSDAARSQRVGSPRGSGQTQGFGYRSAETELGQNYVDDVLDSETQSNFFEGGRTEGTRIAEDVPSADEFVTEPTLTGTQVGGDLLSPGADGDFLGPDTQTFTDVTQDTEPDVVPDFETDYDTETDVTTDVETDILTDTATDTVQESETETEFIQEQESETETEIELEFESESELEARLFDELPGGDSRKKRKDGQFSKEFLSPVASAEDVLSGRTGLGNDES